MYILTTPTLLFTFPPEVDMTNASKIYVTFTDSSNTILLNKTGADLTVTSNSISLFLTQQDTSTLPKKGVKCQINWTFNDGGVLKRACTKVIFISISENLYPQIMTGE